MNQNDFIKVLGIIDTIHDFYDDDINKKYLNLFRKYYLTLESINPNTNKILSESPLFSFIFDINKPILDVNKNRMNKTKYRDIIKSFIIEKFPRNKIIVDEIDNKIYENFIFIFDVDNVKTKKILKKNINQIISKIKIISLRQPLYYLIKNNDDNIIDFFIKYLGLDILSSEMILFIKNEIKENLKKFDKNKNITYPSTFVEDVSKDPETAIYRFHILNKDKNNIDQADVIGHDKYFNYIRHQNYSQQLYISDREHVLQLFVNKNDKIIFLEAEYYLDNKNIICKYKNYIFKVKNNKIGRVKNKNEDNKIFGLYQSIVTIDKIFIKSVDEIKNKNITDTKNIKTIFATIIKTDDKFTLLSEIIDILDLDIQLTNIYIDNLDNIDKCIGIIVFILFGSKRFGDWIQVELAKKYYFMLKTDDFYCRLYSYIMNAPVIIDNIIYNYLPNDNFNNYIDTKIFNKTDEKSNEEKIIDEDKIIFTDTREIEGSLNRYYFNKYLKYKKKYLELCQMI
jgi:hypothetical protein